MGASFADWVVTIPENRFLEEMERVLPWQWIETELTTHLPNPGGGRPPYPFILLFRMTLLQWWNGLSDLETAFQCRDRLSFRKFLGLGLSEKVPDGTTLEDFRHKMEAAGLQQRLLQGMERRLRERGLLAKKGTLVDATFVKAARPKTDTDQQTGRKGRGYRGSIAVDTHTKLVRSVHTTDASVHDSQSLEAVLLWGTGAGPARR